MIKFYIPHSDNLKTLQNTKNLKYINNSCLNLWESPSIEHDFNN